MTEHKQQQKQVQKTGKKAVQKAGKQAVNKAGSKAVSKAGKADDGAGNAAPEAVKISGWMRGGVP